MQILEFSAKNMTYNIGFSSQSDTLVNATCLFPCGKTEDVKILERTFASIVSKAKFSVMQFLDVVVMEFQIDNYKYFVDVDNVFILK